ncbi:adenosylcobinamide-phosphate synthase [Paracoccus alcaliphilus]|uniref:Cobalamin biosynthesis protein CobD n=1 Tax=Paracoccus alcaliphilus TaxID=34002 RepID=A0A1H8G9X9_9RHOB|nr:adenosylcobinamide-phosphate synthase CbiB [Paracoccus alcaliphilus]WCR17903.1 cobalamin biosynthesis protein CobD [Paracoccus alcaliphilus]SEN40649.1 adenosylcobinamide-phosphate synthase [Paracoccus alcaliphilus]
MALTALVALLIDAAIGWPDRIYARIGHPVTWLGRLIAALDRRWNRGESRVWRGALASMLVILAALLPALILQRVLGPVAAGLLAWPLVAARSLHDHLRAVQVPLAAGDLAGARAATAMIVGRDVRQADSPALSRAAIESLAENASDGVIAPLFWAAIFGLPGIAAYKAINTLDSMIGHRSPRYQDFGRFAARLDDAANWIPARLTALLFAAAARSRQAWRIAVRDAGGHRSPNAGWPEAAMAGALGVRLSGPRVYQGRLSAEPWLNGDAPDPDAASIAGALRLYRRAVAVFAGLLLVLTLL